MNAFGKDIFYTACEYYIPVKGTEVNDSVTEACDKAGDFNKGGSNDRENAYKQLRGSFQDLFEEVKENSRINRG